MRARSLPGARIWHDLVRTQEAKLGAGTEARPSAGAVAQGRGLGGIGARFEGHRGEVWVGEGARPRARAGVQPRAGAGKAGRRVRALRDAGARGGDRRRLATVRG